VAHPNSAGYFCSQPARVMLGICASTNNKHSNNNNNNNNIEYDDETLSSYTGDIHKRQIVLLAETILKHWSVKK
jgi:hypothetical protein